MKNIFLFSLFIFAFAKSGVAAVSSQVPINTVLMPKDSTLETQNKAKAEAQKLVKEAKTYTTMALVLIPIYFLIGAFSASIIGVLVALALLLAIVFNIGAIIAYRKTNKLLAQYPSIRSDPDFAKLLKTFLNRFYILNILFALMFLQILALANISATAATRVGFLGIVAFFLLDSTFFKAKP